MLGYFSWLCTVVLSAIDEDSSCVPRLLTDYILKGQLLTRSMFCWYVYFCFTEVNIHCVITQMEMEASGKTVTNRGEAGNTEERLDILQH